MNETSKKLLKRMALISFSVAIIVSSYVVASEGIENQNLCINCGTPVSISVGTSSNIEGDPKRRLYIVEDSTTGMVWIGVAGINQLK